MTDACSICFEETDANNPLVNLHDFSTSHPKDREMAIHRGLNERKHFACENKLLMCFPIILVHRGYDKLRTNGSSKSCSTSFLCYFYQ